MITRKVAPALAAGCTIVVKPAAETPLCALAIAKLALDAGVPAGVLNIVTTKDAAAVGKVLCDDGRVRKLLLHRLDRGRQDALSAMRRHGEEAHPRARRQRAACRVRRRRPRPGGGRRHGLKYRNAGQTCVCANRILVQSGIYDRFAAALVEAVNKLAVGPGMEAGTAIGPLINKAAIEKVETLVGDAVKEGAKVLTGGTLDAAGPLFYRPSVGGRRDPDMEIVREEIFGPVAALVRFDTEADAIRLANDTPFGLAAYLFSRNLSRAWRVAEKLDAGMVGVNERHLLERGRALRRRQGVGPRPRGRRRRLGGVPRDQIHLPGSHRCIIGRAQAQSGYQMRWRGQPVAAILGGARTTTSKLRGPARPPPASTWESEYDRRARQIFHQTHITPLDSEGSRRRRCRHQPLSARSLPPGRKRKRSSISTTGTPISARRRSRTFKEASGIDVNMSLFATNDELFAKLRAGNPGFDVIVPGSEFVQRMVQAELLEPLDHAKIPNIKNVAPEFIKDAPYDPGRKFSMPYTWLVIGIGYRKSKVKETPDSWK
mgnify:CR=1 FL=1